MKNGKSMLSLFAIGAAAIALSAAPAWSQATTPAQPAQPAKPAAPEKEHKHDADKKGKKDKKDEKAQKGEVGPGQPAPNFTGTDTDGKSVTLADMTKAGKVVVIQWFNAECPFVAMHYKESKTFNDLHAKYASKGVEFVAVNSGAPGEQGTGKKLNAEYKTKWAIPYPIILDESGTIGRSYNAKNTPLMVIVDKNGTIAYYGAPDDGQGGKPGKNNYIAKALDEILAGSNVTMPKTKPYGCSVKYGKN